MSQTTAPAVPAGIPEDLHFSQTALLGKLTSKGTKSTQGANGTNSTHAEDAGITTVPLDVLGRFKGTFKGRGFNTIFRPNNTKKPTHLDVRPTDGITDNILQLNLTEETMVFSEPFGKQKDGLIPNRGVDNQEDIALDGLPYTQTVTDVTVKADPQPTIHFENGLWMRVPGSQEPALEPSFVRMASIPHGTTINAQGFKPTITKPGAPVINKININPFIIKTKEPVPFPSQNASDQTTHRLPENLKNPEIQGNITQQMIDNPNIVLQQANEGKTFVDNTTFSISTDAAGTGLGGGTSNIGFLAGSKQVPGNANAVKVTATYWVSTVRTQLQLQPWTPKDKNDTKAFSPVANGSNDLVPVFLATKEITEAKTVTVDYTQIQYSQHILLDFATLSWPHATVGTLVPAGADLSEAIVD